VAVAVSMRVLVSAGPRVFVGLSELSGDAMANVVARSGLGFVAVAVSIRVLVKVTVPYLVDGKKYKQKSALLVQSLSTQLDAMAEAEFAEPTLFPEAVK
jgi:hypothetical protein